MEWKEYGGVVPNDADAFVSSPEAEPITAQ